MDCKIFNELHSKLLEIGISNRNWNLLMPLIKTMKLKKGQFFVRQGGIPKKIGYIHSGVFKAFYLTDKGDEKTIIFRDEGYPISALSSFIGNEASKFSIVALEDSEIFYITIDEFKKLVEFDPFWEIEMGKYYMKLFIEKEERERALLSDDAKTRYEKFKEKNPGIVNRIPLYEIASYLGISNVSLSRIRSQINLPNN